MMFAKNRLMYQWNITESPEILPRKYSQLSLTEGERQYNGAKVDFSTTVAEMTGYLHAKM